MSRALGAGDIAPRFTMTAAVSGRSITLPTHTGQVSVLLFHNHKTIDAVRDINRTVREARYQAEQVLVASVLDLRRVPRLLRGPVEAAIEKVYRGIAEKVPPPYQPEDYIIILPDWKGSVSEAFGVTGVDVAACVIIVDGQGKIAGRYQGAEGLGEHTLALIAGLLPQT